MIESSTLVEFDFQHFSFKTLLLSLVFFRWTEYTERCRFGAFISLGVLWTSWVCGFVSYINLGLFCFKSCICSFLPASDFSVILPMLSVCTAWGQTVVVWAFWNILFYVFAIFPPLCFKDISIGIFLQGEIHFSVLSSLIMSFKCIFNFYYKVMDLQHFFITILELPFLRSHFPFVIIFLTIFPL